jgi:DNA gyrase/topoisomerase IV subunit A
MSDNGAFGSSAQDFDTERARRRLQIVSAILDVVREPAPYWRLVENCATREEAALRLATEHGYEEVVAHHLLDIQLATHLGGNRQALESEAANLRLFLGSQR